MNGRNKISIEVIIRLLLPFVMMIINGSVFGNTYHTNYLTCVYFIYLLLVYRKRIAYEIRRSFIMSKLYKWVIILILWIMFAAILNFKLRDALLFIVMFTTVLLYTDIDQHFVELNIATNIMLIGSLLILMGFNSGRMLNQWNSNQIAMMTVSSVYFALISWEDSQHKLAKAILIAITVQEIWKTDSRAMVAGLLVALVTIWIFSRKWVLNNITLKKIIVNIIAIIPFLIIVWNLYYLESGFSNILDDIFSKYTWKTVHSGREIIWSRYIPIMMQMHYLLIGVGERVSGNMHSLVMDIWYSFGAISLAIYIHMMFGSCKSIVQTKMISDRFVRTCLASFFGMYVAQAFECMSSDTTYFYVFMYTFLAMAVGRCITIEAAERGEI